MKKYFLIILSILNLTKTIAQNTEENSPNRGQDPCARPQIETNPFAPQNTEWNTMRNRFNWMDYITISSAGKARIQYYDINNLYGNGLNSMFYFVNPFFDDNEIYLHHINLHDKPNIYNQLSPDIDYSNFHLLVNEMDITSVEQGWELLWKFDGFEADGVTPISNAMAGEYKAANFILYNRYTGMLRWFMAPKVNNTTFNELEPVIEFKNNTVASLFRNYNGLDQALDKPTIVQRVASPAKTSYNLPYFSMADYNISYDPCVCYFESKLGYSLNAITTASINLYGRLEGTSQMLSANDAINTERLLSLYKDKDVASQVENGLLEYKDYSKLVEDFEKLDGKSIFFDKAYDASKVTADIAEFGLEAVLSSAKPWKSLKTFSKVVSFASMPFKTNKKTKSPPMLMQAQMTLTGQLNSSVPLNGFSFDMQTPGSFKTSSDLSILNSPSNPDRFEYPVYNQAMGLYALLKTPKKEQAAALPNDISIKAAYLIPSNDNNGSPNGYKQIDSLSRPYSFSPRESFKLKEDLEFTFNPSAQINFDATRMEAAWIIEVENEPDSTSAFLNFWNFSSINMSKIYTYQNASNKKITVYAGEFMPIECITHFIPTFDFSLTNKGSRKEVRNTFGNTQNTQFYLTNALNAHVQDLQFSRPKIVATYLKLNIIYRYNKPNGPGLNDIVNFETYKYEIEGNDNNQSILTSPGIQTLSAPSEITIENKTYTQSETIFAWDKITLKGNIKTLNGAQVTFKSAGEISVEPNANIDSEILLIIGNPDICNPQRIQPKIIDASYCNNTALYKGNTTAAKKANNSNIGFNAPKNQSALIFPNPTTGAFNIQTTIENESFINFFVYDISGKLIHENKSTKTYKTGVHSQTFSDVLVENGMYIIDIETSAGREKHKLIKH